MKTQQLKLGPDMTGPLLDAERLRLALSAWRMLPWTERLTPEQWDELRTRHGALLREHLEIIGARGFGS